MARRSVHQQNSAVPKSIGGRCTGANASRSVCRKLGGAPASYLAVGSRETIGRLDVIQRGMQRLADPRGVSEGEAAALIEQLPAVVWLSYGVHGNEISSGMQP